MTVLYLYIYIYIYLYILYLFNLLVNTNAHDPIVMAWLVQSI